MINTEPEKKITNLSTQYIYNETVGSFLLLLLSCVEDLDENDLSKIHDIPTELLELKKEIHNQATGLKYSLADKEVRASALENAFEMRKRITSIYENIYRYFAQWSIISTVVGDEVAIRKYKEEKNQEKNVEFSMFYPDCMDFIESAESASQQKNFMGQLFKCIPFKMARNKYFDLVEKSLYLAFAEESEESITAALNTFKNTCAPDKEPNYGKYFPDVAIAIKDKFTIKPSEMSDSDLDEAFSDLNLVFDNLSEIEDYCQETFSAINSLIILFYLNFSLEDLTENNFGYADVYYKVCEILENPDDTLFNETVKDLLEEYIEPVIDAANELNEKELKLMEKIYDYDNLSEDMCKTLATEGFVRATYLGNINDDIFDFDIDLELPPASEEFKKESFNTFIEFMRGYFAELPITLRKPAMQILLGSLPIAMDIRQLMDYIKDGIDTSSCFEQKLLIIDKVGTVFADNDFDYETDDDHDEDCDCGHEHHHDCSCGHDHHH